MNLLAYPALLATAISIVGLSRIGHKEHATHGPRPLSELAATNERVLKRFQKILWLCGTLFAVTMYGFLVPRTSHAVLVAVFWSLEYLGEMLLTLIPARDKTYQLHEWLAQAMGVGMLGLAYVFCFSTHSAFAAAEIVLSIAMTLAAVLTFADKKRFLFYELAFVFLSHITIVIAVLAAA